MLASALMLPQRPAPPPPLVFWAWEAPHDLRSLPPDAGVAFLAASLLLQGEEVRFRPRLQPLRMDNRTFLMAVIRIETGGPQRPSYSQNQLQGLTDSITRVVKTTGARALQIDFDARQSELAFFRSLIDTLRVRLDTRVFLSVTALASWCDESWLDAIPADEAVAMMFRMGPAGAAILGKLREGQFRAARCRCSIGVSLDEPWPDVRSYERIYVFPGLAGWTPEMAQRVLTRIARERQRR